MTRTQPEASFDVAVVGAGIVGLAHAWVAARRGHRVVLFDRSPQAHGASIRNFGMVWPIGQTLGVCMEIALRSRELWLEFAEQSRAWVNPCGSIHLAHREDELPVLEEFCSLAKGDGLPVRMLSKQEVLDLSPAANPSGLLGGMHSDLELCVNPREVIAGMPEFLIEKCGVETHFNTLITQVGSGQLTASDGRSWQADRIFVCSGSDFQTLFPRVFLGSGLRKCKLQMMRTKPQASGWRIGPHLASGLTLRHYQSFTACPSLEALKQRVANETPELDRFGIHVMASQNNAGEVILGDSHEYDDQLTPFDKSQIEALMLRELAKIIKLPDWEIAERWHGVYAKHPHALIFYAEPADGVHVTVGPGGAGMTMSFGLADQAWRDIEEV
ncbi:MAG: TIGR03364 family FAD-dependent oxidoreductase [Planctomycetaceae bacterium]|nr:TIGR03364 family FAD-dependent oxidoreductase [Planctomycetaceae bacterium]